MPSKSVQICIYLLTVIALSAALSYTKSIMIPFILSLFIAFLLGPLLDMLKQRFKIPNAIGIGILLLGFALFGFVVVVIVASGIRSMLDNIELYQTRLTDLTASLLEAFRSYGFEIPVDRKNLGSLIQSLPVFGLLRSLTKTMINGVSDTVLVTIFALFMLSGKQIALPKLGIWLDIDRGVRSYLLTKFMTSVSTGLLTGVILGLFSVDMALMFGFLAFVLNFIPTLGSILATLLPIPIVLLQFQDPLLIIAAISLPAIVQLVIGNVIEPKFMGDSLDMHPVTILLTLMFWGLIWGPQGMILGTPITVIIKIALEHTEMGRPIAHLMAGRIQKA